MSPPRKVEELANRQGFISEVRRRSKDAASPEALPAEGPWITVSRQAGSQGSDLAVRVAETLGWRTYDREILAAIAAQTHSDEFVLSRLDEQGVSEFHEYLVPLIVPEDPGQARYLVEMTGVIVRLARQGRAVIVGRGANWFLTAACGLRVRTIGPLPARAEEVSRVREVPLDEARRLVAENDAAQRAFVHQAFHREIDDPSGYDLVLNPPELGLAAAVDAVLAAARAKLSLRP